MRWKATCLTALAAVTLLVLSAGTAAADENEAQSPPAESVEAEAQGTAAEVPAGTEMMRVYRDPETGKLTHRPPAGAKALALSEETKEMLSRSNKGLEARVLPDGTVGMDLQGRFMSFAVAHRDADGKLVTDCVHSAEEAEAALDGEVTETREEEPDVR